MIDRSEIQVVIRTRREPANEFLVEWLGRMKLDFRHGSKEYHLDQARDQDVCRFLREDVPNGKRYFLGFDAGAVPLKDTTAILVFPGELVYCGHMAGGGAKGHFGQDDFGLACFRASADLLARIERPWFRLAYIKGVRQGCECNYFRAKAANAGAQPVMAGVVGHLDTCITIPDGAGGHRVVWPHELKEKPDGNW